MRQARGSVMVGRALAMGLLGMWAMVPVTAHAGAGNSAGQGAGKVPRMAAEWGRRALTSRNWQ